MNLIYYPNPFLEKICDEVKDPKSVIKLAASMHTLMQEHNGVGLSAPQVGKKVRLIVIDTLKNKDGRKLTMINPKITSTSEERAAKIEGCLSFPGKFKYINRPLEIEVEWTTLYGITTKDKFSGLTAQAIQHEIDHLNGITFIDERAGINV